MTTPLRVFFAERVYAEMDEAEEWWREHGTGSPSRVKDAVENAAVRLSLFPHLGRPAAAPTLKGRFVLQLVEVPYRLYYEVIEGPTMLIRVLGVHHNRRKPKRGF